MKKLLLKSSVLIFVAGIFASCAGHHLCPAYLKNDQPSIEKHAQFEEVEFASAKK